MNQTPSDLEVVLPSGLKVSYRDWGGAGTTVLLLHGLASSSRIWDFVAPILQTKFRVLAPDQRGHGRSDRPDRSFDFATYVADLVDLHEVLELGRTVLVGLGVAAGIFAIVAMLEAAGWRRNLSSFKALEDNLPLTLLNILNGIIGAGLFEEFIFRGFLFYGLAMAFGGNRVAWMAAALIQSVLFGLSHGYQGALGTVITGTIGLLLAFVYMCTGRNLWAPIIAHAAYDTARAVLFYFQGPP